MPHQGRRRAAGENDSVGEDNRLADRALCARQRRRSATGKIPLEGHIEDTIKVLKNVRSLIHSVKMEPDRGYPQDATAHDTFWDFISLLPESMNMVLGSCQIERSRARSG